MHSFSGPSLTLSVTFYYWLKGENMAINNENEVLHRMRVKLYPNYLPKVKGLFIDVATEAVNETLTPGGIFNISGHKIKVAGDSPEVGVCFVSAADPSVRVKVARHLAENTASKVIGIIPTLTPGAWKPEIVTQFSSGSFFLKDPRIIESSLVLTVPEPASQPGLPS
jgi:hypothetical protein